MKKILALALILTLTSITVSAQRTGNRVYRHSVRQGIRTGELTRLERLDLRRDQYRLNTLQRRAHRDGVVTPYERRKLHRTKVQNRRELYRYKHNFRRR